MAQRVVKSQDGTEYVKDNDLTNQLLERRNEVTPDFLDLKGLMNIPVFVFGREKSDGKYSHFLDGCPYLGKARSATMSYVLEKSEYDSPVLFKTSPSFQHTHHIHGEIYLVSAREILWLDMLNGNNEMSCRRKGFFYLTDQMIKDGVSLKPSIKAYVYIANDDFWEDQRTIRVFPKFQESHGHYEWVNDEQFEIPDFLKKDKEAPINFMMGPHEGPWD